MVEAVDLMRLKELAKEIRVRDLDLIYHAGAGHLGSELSCADILVALYFEVLNYKAAEPKWPERDRFILSKGHAAAILYVTLAKAGFFAEEELDSFLQPNSRLNGHPNAAKVPGVETNTGPLGHGLPVGVGIAKAAKLQGANWRTYVLTGDGELQEGSNWEAAMAAAQFQLNNLTLIIDRNRLQQGARTAETNDLDPLADKWRAFNWRVDEVDGHNFTELLAAFEAARLEPQKPTCIIAHTNKAQGISFAQDQVAWHHKVPNQEQYERARTELTGGLV